MRLKYPLKEVVTINSDASYNNQKKHGGYAYWISYYRGTIKKYGRILDISDPNEAEIKSVIRAFQSIRNINILISVVIINCDNKTVEDIINNKKPHNKFKKISRELLDYCDFYPMVHAKNIKAHTIINNSRQWVNDWCDKMSKEYRKNL